MKKAKFSESKCDRSPLCPVSRVCPTGAVTRVKEGFLKIRISYDESKCVGCGKCAKICPHAAFSLK
ncbi:MAG: 4Fe-4S binding protein [Clostridia bacterium]|nr:4Fe-4S binding protein [Clostridia bacterium]